MTTPPAHIHTAALEGLAAFLFDHPASPDDAIAYWFDGQMTRAEMQQAAVAVAEALRVCGVVQGQPVAHIAESGVTALSVMFGVWLVDAVYVPINGRLTEAEIMAQV